MVCPNCQSDNRDEAKFCDTCGLPLQIVCPVCSTINRVNAKFCDNCGHDLRQKIPGERAATTSPAPAADKKAGASAAADALARYLPPELRAKLEAARAYGRMAGERRIVTALFCDVKGSTAAAELLDPEDWSEIINGAFEHMIRPVYAYEGTVARLMGDGLLAFFGAPMAHEDDPQRAVMAGLEVIEGIAGYSDKAKQRWGIEVAVRIGINTGLVVVGEVGSDLRVEYSALGDAINLAARMEQTASAGTVQIAEPTYRLVAPDFEVEPLGAIEVKGKDQPVPAYRVLRLRPQHLRLRGASEPQAAPLLGRERELATLTKALDSLQAGVGQIVFIVGEAGLGKSRLIEEAHRVWESRRGQLVGAADGRWIESYSASYETDKPYSQFQRLIRQLAQIKHDDAAPVARAKLAGFLAGLGLEPPTQADSVLALLLGLTSDTEAVTTGEAWKRDLFAVIRDLTQRWAAVGPGVVVFDDLQWIDAASADLLLSLIGLTDTSPLLFLCSLRPDRSAVSWQVKTSSERDFAHRYFEVDLRPLAEADSRRLVDHLLVSAPLAVNLADQVIARAEGNPLFLEEVVRALLDQGAGEGGRIPDSLQALLTARIDRLDDTARHTLQMASVIGRRFLHRVLMQICDPTVNLDAELTVLQRADMVREAARIPELEFLFRHALIQEAAYRTILRRQRRDFHRQVAEGIELLYSGRLEEFATQLAHHYDEADDPRAQSYYRMAGDSAMRLYANTEAAMLYGRALELTVANPDATLADLDYLYRRKGRTLEMEGRYAVALANYEAMERTAGQRRDQRLLLAALVEQTQVRATPNNQFDADKAEDLGQRALELARALGDEPAEARILWATMNLGRFTQGRLSRSLADGERALAIARRLNLDEMVAFILNDMLDLVGLNGEFERGREVGMEAIALWRQLGNMPMLADSLSGLSAYDMFAGEYDRALAQADEALRISRSIGNLWGQSYSLSMVGLVYVDRGDPERAILACEECIRLAETVGFIPAQIYTRNILALCYVEIGQIAAARAVAEKAVEVGNLNMQLFRFTGLAALVGVYIEEGRIDEAEDLSSQFETVNAPGNPFIMFERGVQMALTLARGRFDEVLALCEREVALLDQNGMHRSEPELHFMRGLALKGLGRSDEAYTAFQQARADAEGLQARRQLWPALVCLAELERDRGNIAAAQDHEQSARALVTYTAEHISNPAWRASYLGRPSVRRLLDGA